jgi:hypothetical protein
MSRPLALALGPDKVWITGSGAPGAPTDPSAERDPTRSRDAGDANAFAGTAPQQPPRLDSRL